MELVPAVSRLTSTHYLDFLPTNDISCFILKLQLLPPPKLVLTALNEHYHRPKNRPQRPLNRRLPRN